MRKKKLWEKKTKNFNLFKKVDTKQVASGKITDTSNFMTMDEKDSPLANNPNWKAVASEAANERFIIINPKMIPLELRKWMLSRINVDDFVSRLNDKSIVPAYGFIPNCLPGHLKGRQHTNVKRPDITKRLSIKITYGENLPYPEVFKSYLIQVWSHPKLKIEFEELPVSKYLEKMFNKKEQVVIGARGIDYPEGYSVVTYFRSDVESNYFFINSKKIDELIDSSGQELNNEKRYAIYEEIQKNVLKEATVIPIAFGSWKKYYWSNRVKKVPPHPIGIHFMPLEMLVMAGK